MRVLALDTSTTACSVAIGASDRGPESIVARRFEVMERGQSEALAPMVQAVLQDAGLGMGDVDCVAVTTGPGAFTGVRIGLSMARSLGLAANVPVQGVSTMYAVACGVAESNRANASILVFMDTKRDDVYVQAFDPSLAPLGEPNIIAPVEASVLARSLAANHEVIVVGDATERVFGEELRAEENIRVFREVALPDAAVVAEIALAMPVPASDGPMPAPVYLRPPYAKISPTGGKLRP